MEAPLVLNADNNYKKAFQAIFMTTTWSVSRHRNNINFNQANALANKVITEIMVVILYG